MENGNPPSRQQSAGELAKSFSPNPPKEPEVVYELSLGSHRLFEEDEAIKATELGEKFVHFCKENMIEPERIGVVLTRKNIMR